MEIYNDIRIGSIDVIVKKAEEENFIYNCPSRSVDGYIYVLDGNALYTSSSGVKIELKKHSLLLLAKGDKYKIEAKVSGFSYITTGFVLHPKNAFKELGLPEHIDLSDKQYICKQLAEVLNIWEERLSWYLTETRIAMEKILIELIEMYGKSSDGFRFSGKLSPALSFINRHYDSNITNERLAEMCGLSVTHFRRLFKEEIGSSPIRYLTSVRIHWAVKLLKSQMFSVSEVAEQVGFSDIYYFSKTVKQYTGKSPSEYKV